jgi:hypothetical protein
LMLNELTVQYGNSLEHGGAIYNEGGYVRLTNVSLLHNSASGYGGAYATTPGAEPPSPLLSPDHLLAAGPTLDCSVCFLQYNSAGSSGGAIFSYRGLLMMDDAYFEENTADAGGAIFMEGGNMTVIDNAAFINNSAAFSNGGAVYIIQDVGSASIQRSDFQGNVAAAYGGALYANSGTINVSDSSFRHNEATYDGGALAIPNGVSLVLGQVEIDHNSSVSGSGGGISLLGNLDATNVTISRNLSYGKGAGLYTNGSGLTRVSLAFSTIAFNLDEDLDNNGDGIWAESGDVSLEATILAYNGAASVDGHNCGGGSGSIITDGFNIETGKTCNLDYSSTDLIYTDPRLGSLGQHGSLNGTQTYNLLFDSPAIDFFEGSLCPSVDQRNFDRPRYGGGESMLCDVGAYETDRPMLFLPVVIRP